MAGLRWDRATALEAVLVVAGLAAAVALFVRSYDRPAAPLAFSLDASAEGVVETWSGIYVGTEKIGTSVHRSAPRDDGGLILQERTNLRLLLLGAVNEITLANDVHLAPSGTVEHLRAQVRTTVAGQPVSLRAEGRAVPNGMEIELYQGGARLSTLSLPEVPATSATLYRAVLDRDPAPGTSLTVPYFNPLTLGSAAATIKVLAREPATTPTGEQITALRLRVEAGGQVLDVLLAPTGERLEEREAEGGLGMRVVWETQQRALHEGWPADATDAVDLVALSSIPLDQKLPDGGRTLRRLVLEVQGPVALHALLTGVHGDRWDPTTRRLTLLRSDPTGAASYPLPTQDRDLAPFLAASPFIQSDDPSMVRTAGQILGDRLDAVAAAEVLGAWVHKNIEKVPVAGIPSALEVLSSRRGDCNEHTTLFAGLARSVGLPTRLLAGIVYSESIFADGAFYYHAWPEVWLGDRWLALDPTFGQFPADATHLALVHGELDQQTELMAVIGRLRLSVVEASP